MAFKVIADLTIPEGKPGRTSGERSEVSLNNFIFENTTEVYFGEGYVREYLRCLTRHYEGTIMLAYGGGSIKEYGIYEEVMEIYFSGLDEDNVSDDIVEALMRNVIRNLRTAITDPQDYTARSNLTWDSVKAENRIIKLGKRTGLRVSSDGASVWRVYGLQPWSRTCSAASGLLPSYLQGRDGEV